MIKKVWTKKIAKFFLIDKIKKLKLQNPSPPLPAVFVDSKKVATYAGIFRNPVDETIRQIVIKNGELLYVRPGTSSSQLFSIGEDKFKMLGVPTETNVVFVRSRNGMVSGFSVLTKDTKPINFESFVP